MGSSKSGFSACTAVIFLLSIFLMIAGFIDMFQHKPKDGKTELNVISRQLRGLGFLLLSMVILSLGTLMCVGGFAKSSPVDNLLEF